MADRTEGSIVIGAAPDRVMQEILDFESYPEWSGEIKKVEIRSKDDAGRATEVYYEIVAAVLSAKYTLAYTYPEDGSGMSWTLSSGGPIKGFDGEYVLEQEGAGTKVTYRAAMDLGVPMPGFLKRQGEKRVIDVALKGLKKRVEQAG